MNLKKLIREEIDDFDWVDDANQLGDSEFRKAVFDLQIERMKKSLYGHQEQIASWVQDGVDDYESDGVTKIGERDIKQWLRDDAGESDIFIPDCWVSDRYFEEEYIDPLWQKFSDDTYDKYFAPNAPMAYKIGRVNEAHNLLEEDDFDWDEVLRNQRNEEDDKYYRLEQDFSECIRNLQEKYSQGENKIGYDSYATIDVMKQILPQLLDEMFQEL